jgi:hypothetical protein
MRYDEWFNLQDLLDTSMNRDRTAGAALGTPSPPSMAGSNFSWCLLLVLAVGACCWCLLLVLHSSQAYLRAAHGASGSAPAEVTIRIRAMAVV